MVAAARGAISAAALLGVVGRSGDGGAVADRVKFDGGQRIAVQQDGVTVAAAADLLAGGGAVQFAIIRTGRG